MGPDRLIENSPILGGASSPTGNPLEVILLLTGCLDAGVTDRLPSPVLPYFFNKILITMQVSVERSLTVGDETF